MNANVNRILGIGVVGLVLAGGMVGSALALSRFMIRIQQQQENTISAKGLAERRIQSDIGGFDCRVAVSATTLEEGYKKLTKDYFRLKSRLLKAGFPEDDIHESPLTYHPVYKTIRTRDAGTREQITEEFSHYRFTRALRVVSGRVDLVHRQSMELPSLILEGVELDLDSPQYYVSDLEKYKLALIAEATDSAMQRARTTAEKCQSRVGRLITARNGVIQVTRVASSEMSDSGYYDTSSREKVMKVVVSATFEAL